MFVSDLQLVQIMLAADDCRKSKKYQNRKGPPKKKGLKNQNPYGEEWREDPIVLEAHGLLQSTNRSPKRAPLAAAARALCCVSYFCVHSRVRVCLDFGLSLMFSKKAVPAAMVRLFLFVSVCLCLCAWSCSLERGVVFLM